MGISVISTVFNEGDNLRKLMDSLVAQTRQPDEVIIVDGGSSDNTVEVLREYEATLPLTIVVEDGCNISEGRNRALQDVQEDIIAITDAGVQLDNGWLETIIAPFGENPETMVVAGFFEADTYNLFEIALGATTLPLAEEIDPETFLPSSRSVAVRRAAIQEIGGYPVWLDYCEDLVFDLRLKSKYPNFVFCPNAVVYFRPRSTLSAYFRQYYLYARGDGKANLWRKRHLIRYVTYLIVIPLIFLMGWFIHPLLWGLYILGGIIYLWKPYQRMPIVLEHSKIEPERKRSVFSRLQIALMIPVIRVVGDVAKMLGYPVGWIWRIRNHPPDWRI